MDLSIIIVNWHSRDYLQKCIASILAETRGMEFEIVVIDSASFDGCDEMLRRNFPQVRFIQSDQNLGFAKANNQAFQEARGRTLLFLNPDTELAGPAINTLHVMLWSLPGAGVVGAKLLNSDRTLQTSCVQAFPTILNQLLDTEVLRGWFPRARLWGMRPLFEDGSIPSEVDAISGACLMLKRELFEQVGGFSAEYFMYSEDVDLSFKVRAAGWRNYYVPEAALVHHGGGSTRQKTVNPLTTVLHLESRWKFFRKTRSVWYCWAYRVSTVMAAAVRLLLLLIVYAACRPLRIPASIDGAFKKWWSGFRWGVGLAERVQRL